MRENGVKITMVHMTTAVLARAMAFDVPEMNCFIRRGAVVGRNHIDVMVPVQVGGDTGVTAAIIRNTHARRVSDIAAEIRDKAARSRDGEEIRAAKNKYVLNRIHWPTTVRMRRLMTKEFELDPTSDVWLFLDMERQSWGRSPNVASITTCSPSRTMVNLTRCPTSVSVSRYMVRSRLV